MKRNGTPTAKETMRVAIYTRKSTEEGLDSDFSSLDAQREACEAYIASQKHEGWVCLVDRYDDGGYSGATADRPALKRLLCDVEAGKVDVVVAYRLDRVSRFLPDFVRINETLANHDCALVSVTEAFSTATPAGRLHLNMLMSFAQHEREVIAERTRDKMSAARRKGRWTGGCPVLGYDVDPDGGSIHVNAGEAKQVRDIFQLYLDRGSLSETVDELNRRGWKTKAWTTRRGVERVGHEFHKNTVALLLGNVAYIGKVRHRDVIYPGQHEAIVDEALFEQVQKQLRRNGRSGGPAVRNKYGALLRGLLHCGHCETPMSHVYTSKGGRRYRYYGCVRGRKDAGCATPTLPAPEIERVVFDRIRCVGRDGEVLTAVQDQLEKPFDDLAGRLAELEPVWDCLSPREQCRVVELIIEKITFHADRESVSITFRPSGIASLAEGVAL